MVLSNLKQKALPSWCRQRASRPTDTLHLRAANMLDYYNKRLNEYEAIYAKPERQTDLQKLVAQLQRDVSQCSVLELACGTGWWTERLAPHAASWTATDADLGALEVVRHKNIQGLSETHTLNAYQPQITTPVDCVFAAHWYSHLLLDERTAFFDAVSTCLKPGGRLIMLDNNYVIGSSTPISRTDAHGNTYQARPLQDGSTHEVLKNFPSQTALKLSLIHI
jgi:2-polyprenyl-3-methyl-5-hydroxy-6-metoxy-1,4-benzoquinol methylase